jgi:hypothetical protein
VFLGRRLGAHVDEVGKVVTDCPPSVCNKATNPAMDLTLIWTYESKGW